MTNSMKEFVFRATQDAFGVTATYTHTEDSSTDVLVGVFNHEMVEFQGAQVSVLSQMPTFRYWLADLSKDAVENDILTIDTVNYTVKDCQLDPHGGAKLILEKSN